MRTTRLERLLADPHIAIVEAIVAHLRAQAPRLVPTTEIAMVIGRRTAQVYGLIKKGRELLSLTTGEFIPNTAKRKHKAIHGYTVTNSPRAAEFEAAKSFDRAAGHLSVGVATHGRVSRAAMTTPEDLELWLVTQHRSRAARSFLDASEEARTGIALTPSGSSGGGGGNNGRLLAASRAETITPWESIGLENHHEIEVDDDDSDA